MVTDTLARQLSVPCSNRIYRIARDGLVWFVVVSDTLAQGGVVGVWAGFDRIYRINRIEGRW